MFRLKDHIISLAAVFLALGLGILIGSGMGDDMLIKQQRLIIEQLSRDFRVIREERTALEAKVQILSRDLGFWEKYRDTVNSQLIGGILEQKKAALVCHGTQLPQGVVKVLQDAGVILTGVVIVNNQAEWSDSDGLLPAGLFSVLTGESPAGRAKDFLDSLMVSEKVHVQALQEDRPEAVILLCGDRRSTNRQFILALCERLQQAELTVVAMEDSTISDSLLFLFKEKGVSTIDNADTVFGQVSLIAVLKGSAGHFGFKETAEQFLAPFQAQ